MIAERTMQNNSQAVSRFEVNTAEHVRVDGKHQACGNQGVDDLQVQHQNGEAARETLRLEMTCQQYN
ncbi:hypothetical protein FEM48_Zijuj09G0078000 [Ziziphus jujuba var. spinosa]|uniref:Uncharacterized protein n=1 Tax=Ziziphus jujuba var. spinosa TaxID=714518 RepID=A0A978URR1_ZIZJJ|nr:hypothetical protein FEM48_Zijuj09G0078000 [Ziziphus jujuba var. spinosa]